MIAPLPEFDKFESPIAFVAIIDAKTLSPLTKLNGSAVIYDKRDVQLVLVTIIGELEPLHPTNS